MYVLALDDKKAAEVVFWLKSSWLTTVVVMNATFCAAKALMVQTVWICSVPSTTQRYQFGQRFSFTINLI